MLIGWLVELLLSLGFRVAIIAIVTIATRLAIITVLPTIMVVFELPLTTSRLACVKQSLRGLVSVIVILAIRIQIIILIITVKQW